MSEQLRPRRQIHRLELEPGEHWWGGAVSDGQAMPFGDRAHRRDLAVNAGFVDDPVRGPNQSAPLLVSSAGRYLWSERPFSFAFDGAGGLEVAGAEVIVGQDGVALASAYRSAAGRFFPPSGRSPAATMFAAPQYNTWIEMPYHPTQQAVTRLRPRSAGRWVPAGSDHDRRPLVGRLRRSGPSTRPGSPDRRR